MTIIYFILAILTLTLAHLFKVERQKQFIEIYEPPKTKKLLQGLSISYIINLFFPLKIGNLFRIIYPGKYMKNGISFSLATIVLDIVLDFFSVTIIYAIFWIFKLPVQNVLLFYIIVSIGLILGLVIAVYFNHFIKRVILNISGIFNENIELKLLKTFWFTITAFKDMLQKVNKKILLLYTIVPWSLYLLSYYLFSLCLKENQIIFSFLDMFNLFYSISNLSIPALSIFRNHYINLLNFILFVSYITIPLILIYLYSFIFKIEKKEEKKHYIEILPHINMQDRLAFLVAYFSAENRDYFKNYIALNQDISIIQDFSAGSNATTMLCTYDNKMVFRKYTFGRDSEKLYEQIKWLQQHKSILPVTEVLNIKKGSDYCSYDMPYDKDAMSCFNYVHSVPINNAWSMLKKALDSLDKLYEKKEKSNRTIIDNYIEGKVIKNIVKIENGRYIKPLLKYDFLIINGKPYPNLKKYKKYFTKSYLEKVFENDVITDIHGDFTIENIIINKNSFYIIDPNTGNVLDSPNLDYAKLLQSLHGGYEFLMNTKNIEVEENRINFLSSKSLVYEKIYKKYDEYLYQKFSLDVVKSIYFHEIIHWLRLMPYKIEKNGERQVLFYAGLLMVMNDVIERFGG